MPRISSGLLGSALAGCVLVMIPRPADACGGLFCDGGPVPMPVDQTGEDILFVDQGESLDVHIRIQYEGEAQNFAWVIPVLSEPTDFRVGSEPLFQQIKAASVPQYGFQTTPDTCGDERGVAGSPLGGQSDGSDDGDGTGKGTVDVLVQKQVGAFEISIVDSTDVKALAEWLDENGYQQDPDALPIIAEYLAENHLFAAIKLTGSAGVEEIHPIVLSFDHTEACVPLRLTRIAAKDDMDVRTYFLGDARVVPRTYRHVLVNELRIDWPNQATNYKDVITQAVDAEHADGRAFVTEYAGPSNIVWRGGVYSAAWNPDVFAASGFAPVNVVDHLAMQGLYSCDEWSGCTAFHPLIDGLLGQYLPVPAGVDPQSFYTCLECYQDSIDLEAWDGAAFAQALQERIVDPGLEADAILQTHSYLTRMYTTISPHEMMSDPMFHPNPDLEEVANVRIAQQRITCNGDSIWTLPNGTEVFVPEGSPWPGFNDSMPWEQQVQETPAHGAPMVLADRSADIKHALDAYHDDVGYNDGCSCRTDGGNRSLGIGWLVLFALGGLARRSRSRRCAS